MSYSFQSSQIQNSLAKYEIVKPIGRGAGSFVYKIKERKTGKFAALKVVEKCSQRFAKIRSRILNEIDIHSKLDHENIVKLLTHFEDEDNYYILLELCEGGELYSKTKGNGKLSEDEVRTYGFQLAKALKYLHQNKIMHRDLKLSNLLLTNQDVVKICDFGLSVRMSDLKAERDTLCGTPNYLSPEIVNQEAYGIKADCWAFGCILYAMATGAPPFEGETVKETLSNVKKGTLRVPDYLSNHLKDLLLNLLNWNKDPEKRFTIQDAISHPFFASSLAPSRATSNGVEQHFVKNERKVLCEINNGNVRKNKEEGSGSNPSSDKIRTSGHTKCFSTVTPVQTRMSENIPPNSIHVRPFDINSQPSSNLNRAKIHPDKLTQYLNTIDDVHVRKNIDSNNANTQRKVLAPIRTMSISRPIGHTVTPKEIDERSRNGRINPLTHKRSPIQEDETSFMTQDNTINTSLALNSTSRTSPGRGNEQFLSFTTEDDEAAFSDRNIKPLNTFGLKPYKYTTKNGIIEIHKDGVVSLDVVNKKRKLLISQDGLRVTVVRNAAILEEKTYELLRLPPKYHKFYEYVSKVCEVLRSKVPRVKIEDQDGCFYLLKTSPFPNFEARFKNGVKVKHTLSSEMIKVHMNDGSVYEINILGETSYLGTFLNSIVTKTLEKMNLCLQKEKRAS